MTITSDWAYQFYSKSWLCWREELWVGLDCGENRSHEKTRGKWKMMVPNFVFLRAFEFSALKAVKYQEEKKEVASMIQYLRTIPMKLVSRVPRVNRSVVERPRTFSSRTFLEPTPSHVKTIWNYVMEHIEEPKSCNSIAISRFLFLRELK